MDLNERLPGMMHSVGEIIEEAEKAITEAEKYCLRARKWLGDLAATEQDEGDTDKKPERYYNEGVHWCSICGEDMSGKESHAHWVDEQGRERCTPDETETTKGDET